MTAGAAAAPGPDLRATGDRIEALLDASTLGGPMGRERAEELVRLVVDHYGAGLERVLEIVHDSGRLDDDVVDRLADDDLVASLLLVHGLHPYDVETRVARALDRVRPYLGSHGGGVDLVEVSDEGVVTLQMLGSCDGCPSSAVTLSLAVETAIRDAAPEVTAIEVQEAPSEPAGPSVIPVSALRSRLDTGAAAVGWEPVAGLVGLVSGQVGGFVVAGTPVVGARVGSDLYAYRDHCPRCGSGLADAVVERLLGGRPGDVARRCPQCRAHFDVRRAGAGLDDADEHLDPLPLLVQDGVASVALPAVPSGATA